LAHIETAAVEANGGYLVNGEKTLIGNAPDADLFLLLARQFPERAALGLTAFMLPADTRGLEVTPITSTVGLPGLPIGNVKFNDCFVPSDMVLGQPGGGLRVFSTAMQWERTCLLAGFQGAADRDLELCLRALRTRGNHAGSPLRHQAVSHRLARAKLRIESARLLAYRAACYLDEGRDDYVIAAMAKLAVSESVVATAEDGLHLLAGLAWRGEPVDLGAAFNDSLGGLFASGTSEIQLELLARSLQVEKCRP